jgi:DNA-binding NarL/FixJ family response regulator
MINQGAERMIRIYLIEDHHVIIVSGFKRLFNASRDGIEVGGSSGNVEDVIARVSPDSFDILILDLWLENRMPIENIRRLKSHFPGKPIIIYTSETSYSWRQVMYREGAMAYLTKSATRQEIRSTLEKVSAGEKYFPLMIDQVLGKEAVSGPESAPSLTPIQQEVVLLLRKGMTHKEIAAAIHTSVSNLEKMFKTLRDRFNVKNNIELLTFLPDTPEI